VLHRYLRLLAPPFVVMAAVSLAGAEAEMTRLFDFDDAEPAWYTVDDVVMGGVSSSTWEPGDGIAVFKGQVSLENNGGFASARSRPFDTDLSGHDRVRLRVKGDGKRYEFRIRTSESSRAPSYRAGFLTKPGEWIEVELRFEDFIAGWRGRTFPDYPPLDAGEVTSVGLLIADKQEGPFRLEVDWIRAEPAPFEV